MHDFSQCKLELTFEFGATNNKYMDLDVNGYNVSPDCPCVTLLISLPTTVYLIVSNKDPTDTIVDSNGNIVQDCYVKLSSMTIDGFNINEKFLHQKIILTTVNGFAVTSSYFGFNGTIELVLDRKSVMSQCLYLNR